MRAPDEGQAAHELQSPDETQAGHEPQVLDEELAAHEPQVPDGARAAHEPRSPDEVRSPGWPQAEVWSGGAEWAGHELQSSDEKRAAYGREAPGEPQSPYSTRWADEARYKGALREWPGLSADWRRSSVALGPLCLPLTVRQHDFQQPCRVPPPALAATTP